jgi:hypothetical protein
MIDQSNFVYELLNSFFGSIKDMFALVSWSDMYYIGRRVFSVLDLLLLVGVIVLWYEGKKLRPKIYKDPYMALHKKREDVRVRDEMLKKQWLALINKSESAVPQSLSLAIIEADTFVDSILKNQLRLPGEHMADRLDRLSSEDLRTLDKLWRAHRIRNDLVHTPGFYLAANDARNVLSDYEAFLKELEVV